MTETTEARFQRELDKLAPRIRKAFLDAMGRNASAVSIRDLVAALERGDVYAAAALLDLNPATLYPVTEIIREAYIAAGQSAANDLHWRIRATFGFGGNPRAEAAVDRITGQFITRMVDGNREAVQDVVRTLVDEGVPARRAALAIVGKINPVTGLRDGGFLGLDGGVLPDGRVTGRLGVAKRVAAMLRDPELIKEYFIGAKPRYKTTDRRFDKMVRRAIAEGRALTQAEADKITKAHKARLLKNRGDTIAHSEGLTALRKGTHDGWAELVASGAVANDRIERTWLSGRDGRTRHDHVTMQGQKRIGVDTPFTFPDGHLAMFPGDPSLGAGPEDLIECRCVEIFRLRRRNGG